MNSINKIAAQKITNFLKQFAFLTPDEINYFISLCQYKTLSKGDYFTKEGKVCNEIGFVLTGVFRSYYLSSSDDEITYCFIQQDHFITAYSSFITKNKTLENIQALTDVEMLVITRENVKKIEQSSNNWLLFLKMMAEQEYINLERRIFLLQKEKAETRYKDLILNKPNILQLVPLHYIASYLGITQRHLSRLRKKIT